MSTVVDITPIEVLTKVRHRMATQPEHVIKSYSKGNVPDASAACYCVVGALLHEADPDELPFALSMMSLPADGPHREAFNALGRQALLSFDLEKYSPRLTNEHEAITEINDTKGREAVLDLIDKAIEDLRSRASS